MAEISTGYKYCSWQIRVGGTIKVRILKYDTEGKVVSKPATNYERPIDSKTGKLATDAVYKRMASKYQEKLQKEADNQTVSKADASLTLAEYMETYIKEVVFDPARDIKPGTKRGYRHKLQTMQRWAIAQHPIRQITTSQLRELFRNKLNPKEEQEGEGYKPSYMAKCYEMLNLVFEFAVDEQIIPSNPFKTKPGVKKPQVPRPQRKEGVTPEVLWEWLDKASRLSKRDEAINWMCVWLGIRPAELAGLNWNHINWDTTPPIVQIKQIRVIGDVSPSQLNVSMLQSGSKTENGVRDIFMVKYLVDFLHKWKKHQQENALYKWSEETPIITQSDGSGSVNLQGEDGKFYSKKDKKYTGEPISIKRIERAINSIRNQEFNSTKIDMTEFTPMTFRKLFAWNLHQSGMSETLIIKYLGHSDIKVTRDHYFTMQTDTSADDELKFHEHIQRLA